MKYHGRFKQIKVPTSLFRRMRQGWEAYILINDHVLLDYKTVF